MEMDIEIINIGTERLALLKHNCQLARDKYCHPYKYLVTSHEKRKLEHIPPNSRLVKK